MAVARRKVSRTTRKTTSKNTSVAPRRKATARKPAPMGEDRLLRSLQQGLFNTLSSSEGEGRSPIGVSAVFVQLFLHLTKVQAMAVYVRDEQTREMTCLAEVGSSDPSMAEQWREGLTRAEQQTQITAGTCTDVPVAPNRPNGRCRDVPNRKNPTVTARKLLTLLTAVEPWLAVLLDHARLTVKYAAKILRIQHMEQVSDILNSSLAEEEKLRRALDAAIRLFEAEAGALFLELPTGR